MKRNPQTAYAAAIRLAYRELASERPIDWKAYLGSAANSLNLIENNKSISYVQIDANLCKLAEITAWATVTAKEVIVQTCPGNAEEFSVTTKQVDLLTDSTYKKLISLYLPMVFARLSGKVAMRSFRETQMRGMCRLIRDMIEKLRSILEPNPSVAPYKASPQA